jgi:hypothetical protein
MFLNRNEIEWQGQVQISVAPGERVGGEAEIHQ